MGTLRSILDRLTGQTSDGIASAVRAFGKWPGCGEYLRLNSTTPTDRAFEQWITSGHDQWVLETAAAARGRVVATRVMLQLAGHPETVFARIWPSRDAAGRSFPFSLFVRARVGRLGWVERFALGSLVWNWFDSLHDQFDPGASSLSAVRGEVIAINRNAALERLKDIEADQQDIPLTEWMAALLKTMELTDEAAFTARLGQTARNWLRGDRGAGIALPLLRHWDATAQAGAWLDWLTGHAPEPGVVSGTLWRDNQSDAPAVLCVLTRAPLARDFQAVTTATEGLDHLETPRAATRVPRPGQLAGLARMCGDRERSLRDFAQWRFTAE